MFEFPKKILTHLVGMAGESMVENPLASAVFLFPAPGPGKSQTELIDVMNHISRKPRSPARIEPHLESHFVPR